MNSEETYDLLERIGQCRRDDTNEIEEIKKCLLAYEGEGGIDFREAYDGIGEFTPFLCACLHGHYALATWLLEQGADASAVDCEGNTCIHVMMDCDIEDTDFLKLVIEKGADVNAVNEMGMTALHKASSGYASLLAVLIPLVPDINVLTEDGLSPLYFAAVDGNYKECEKLLLDAGASKETINRMVDTDY